MPHPRASSDSHLTTVHPGLLATPTSRLPYQHDVLLRSYVLQRPSGNVLVYNSPGLDLASDAIRALGVPSLLLVTHAHESMYGNSGMDVPVWMHADDRGEAGSEFRVSGTFDGPRSIDDDLQVIPTPGHTPGTTSYLWDSGTHRYLFTGDFIWVERRRWSAVVLDPRLREAYVESLLLVRDLDFDVLVPWGVTEGDSPLDVVGDPAERRTRIEAVIGRVEGGAAR